MREVDLESGNRPAKMSWSKKIFFTLLEKLEHGYIEVNEGENCYCFGDSHSDLYAIITISDPKAYRRILWGGSIGAAEAYVEGLWHTDDLTAVIRLFSRNLKKLERYEKRFAIVSKLVSLFKHRLNSNSKSGSRTNIASHYDLSNEMYQLFLDPHMQYSSAIFPEANSSLKEAQEHKMALICNYLELNENDHLLEIGTGWGGLACYAAKHYGCKVTTTTISAAQFAIAEQRIKDEGLSDKITLLLEDYRDLNGQYSKIVSIEMIEAVGHQFMPTYFRMLEALLQPGGKVLLQAITINDQRYDDYRNSVDFIQHYIFPGGHLPSVSLICEQLKQQTTMYIEHLRDYRLDYADTLKAWRKKFLSDKKTINDLGFNDDFIRLWDYYFSYCEGGFREKVIGLAHIGIVKSPH